MTDSRRERDPLLWFLIRSDLHRYGQGTGAKAFLLSFLFCPGFTFSCWLRVRAWARAGGTMRRVVFSWTRVVLRHYMIRYGISMSPDVAVGPGLHIGHHGGIVVADKVSIGRNCNLSHGVTLGVTNRGVRAGCPSIGDNVYIGPGAKLIGGIRVGNSAAIGANAVVTHDVPDGGVVVGVPGRVISLEGSAGYVNFTDYDDFAE